MTKEELEKRVEELELTIKGMIARLPDEEELKQVSYYYFKNINYPYMLGYAVSSIKMVKELGKNKLKE